MLLLAVKKMWKNRTLFLCLFMACVFSVALLAALPVFEYAVYNRMLQQDLKKLIDDRGLPPLVHTISLSGDRLSIFLRETGHITDDSNNISYVDVWE